MFWCGIESMVHGSRYSGEVFSENKPAGPFIGLCADCRHLRVITSDRGSKFYLCQRSATDPNFPKYPRLPVIQCRGYERKGSGERTAS